MDDIDNLIDELLKRELRPNTREDLATWRKELAAGSLSADDARYIRGLHQRVVGGGAPIAKPKDDDEDDGDESEVEKLRTALAAAQAKADTLAAEVAALKAELEALKSKAS